MNNFEKYENLILKKELIDVDIERINKRNIKNNFFFKNNIGFNSIIFLFFLIPVYFLFFDDIIINMISVIFLVGFLSNTLFNIRDFFNSNKNFFNVQNILGSIFFTSFINLFGQSYLNNSSSPIEDNVVNFFNLIPMIDKYLFLLLTVILVSKLVRDLIIYIKPKEEVNKDEVNKDEIEQLKNNSEKISIYIKNIKKEIIENINILKIEYLISVAHENEYKNSSILLNDFLKSYMDEKGLNKRSQFLEHIENENVLGISIENE